MPYIKRRPYVRQDDGVSKIYPYMVKMASNSYIHGVKEVYSSRSKHEKAFWILVCLCCAAAATYEITQIIILYREKGIATKIHITSIKNMTYPTILVCPTKWVSKKKVDELAVDREIVAYLLSLFETVVPGQVMDLNLNERTLPAKVRASMQKTRSKTVADLALNISINVGSENVKCSCCKMETIKKLVTLHGVCFQMDLCSTLYQSREKSPHLLFIINATDAIRNFDTVDGGVMALYESRSQIGISVNDHILLFADTMTMVKLSLSHIKRISTTKMPCADVSSSRTSAMCEFDCIDKTENRLCHNCSKYSMFEASPSFKQCEGRQFAICSKDLKTIVEQKLLECKDKCLPRCEQLVYNVQSVTTMNFPKTHQCGTEEWSDCLQVVLFFPMFTTCEYEDVPTISIDTFISSIGGQTGLWCGASVVSLCQIISYFCCPCLHWADLRSSYASFTTNKKAKPSKFNNQRRHSEMPTAGVDQT